MLLRGLIMLFSGTSIPRVIARLMLDGRVPLRAKLILPAAILYLISPVDLVPDIVPLHGWIDDILAIVVSLVLFLGMAPKDIVWEHIRGRGRRPNPDTQGQKADPDKTIIEGSYRHIDDDEHQ